MFVLIALLVFSTASFAAETKDYKLTAPTGSTSMNYEKGAYNDLGELKIEVDNDDTTATFSAETTVKVIVSYDKKFSLTNAPDTVAYKIVTGTSPDIADLPDDNTITFDVGGERSKSVKIGAVITGESSNVSDGDYIAKKLIKCII